MNDHKSQEELSKKVAEAKTKLKIGGKYKHYKGNLYIVRDIVLHSETLEPLVLYEPQYETGVKLWVRPFEMFIEDVEIDGIKVPRFELVEN